MEELNKLSIEGLKKITFGGWMYFTTLFPELLNAKINDNRCNNIINHMRGEKNASLSCYCKRGIWYLHDHADPEFSGDQFKIYSYLNDGANFKDSLKGIYEEVTGEEAPEFERTGKSNLEESTLEEGVPFKVEPIPFDKLPEAEESFLNKYGISKKIMKENNSCFLFSYTFHANSGKVYKKSRIDRSIIIGYKVDDSVKIYHPFEKEYKFMWLGEKPQEYIFGFNILEKYRDKTKEQYLSEGICTTTEKIILCAGEKDTLVAQSNGLKAICLNSETTTFLPQKLYALLKELMDYTFEYSRLVIAYDNDKTGIKQGKVFQNKFSNYSFIIEVIKWPVKLGKVGGKDLSDWISLGLPKDELVHRLSRSFKYENNVDAQFSSDEKLIPISAVSPRTTFRKEYYNSQQDLDIIIENIDEIDEDQTLNIEIVDEPKPVEEDVQDDEEQDDEDEKEDSCVNLNSANSLPDGLYEDLPKILQQCIQPFDEEHKTMMLLSFITVLGSVFRNVTAKFRRDKVFPNLYTVIIAPPASGKSLIKWARYLIMPVERFLHVNSTNALKEYQRNSKMAKNDEGQKSELGPEPPYEVLLIPTDITSSMWIEQMSDNNGYGLMYDTEIDGLVESNSGNIRSFTDSLRKVYEGEPVSLMRRKDRERINVEEGKMSLLLSGTPAQFLKLTPDAENGLFSRIIPLNFNGSLKWKNAFESDEFDFENHFKKLSLDVFSFFQILDELDNPIIFKLSKDQLLNFDKEFSKRFEEVKNVAGIDGRATVLRLGAITIKIAMILDTLNRLENNEIAGRHICSDQNFQTAMTITAVILNHVLLTLKMMKEDRIEHCYRGKKLDYYYSLPKTFSYSQSQQIAEDENVKLRTAQKWIYEFRNKGFLVNPVKGKFRKVG